MKKKRFGRTLLSLALVLALLSGYLVPVSAVSGGWEELSFTKTEDSVTPEISNQANEEEETPAHSDDEIVRVSILLEGKSAIEAGFSTAQIASNEKAAAYREKLKSQQAELTAKIEQVTKQKLDVVWNLTLAANLISTNVPYGEIETIKAVPGVKGVVLEAKYEPCQTEDTTADGPMMATSGNMIGTSVAYASGYTGAGRRIAVIDTGIDLDHESFDAGAFDYALKELGGNYNLLGAEEIAKVLPQLNAAQRSKGLTAEQLYKTTKIPYGYNYVDSSYFYVDHDSDSQGEHGSHVEGIAAANRYVPNEDGSYSKALDTTLVQGVAPDAQLIVMKVFGKNGGAYDSDYMAALEDAVVLGCDSVNMSLGSSYPGFSRSPAYDELLERVSKSDTVVTIAAGNAGHWAQYSKNGVTNALYAGDVGTDTTGQPGSFRNSLAIASVDNTGSTGNYIEVAGQKIVYAEPNYKNAKLTTLAGEQEYVFLDGFGSEGDFAAVADVLAGKIAICSRGGMISFSAKADAAVKYGAIATIIYNNEAGVNNMNLADYQSRKPCVSVLQADGAAIRAASTPVVDEEGNTLYLTGKMTIGTTFASVDQKVDHYTMSSFSSWGVPGNLTIKPEISAPGGNIYSVNGAIAGGKSYETMSGTSMASPQVAGMAALVAQYIDTKNLADKTGLSVRTLSQSLLMSTAEPVMDENGNAYSILQQGAGIANVGKAVTAGSYVLMGADANASYLDGKVKVETGDDPQRTGAYEFSFTLNDLSGKDQTFSLYADLFTQETFAQDGQLFAGTATSALAAGVTWTVDGKVLEVAEDLRDFDANEDGIVDTRDVQAILDYVTGLRKTIGSADVDGDGEVSAYDAYLLLKKLNTSTLELSANGSAKITVSVQLTEAQKEELDKTFKTGAYIEGFFYAQQLPDAEGVEGTCHSIPLLGYYGSWSEPTMFERTSFVDRLYGTGLSSYSGYSAQNALILGYPGDSQLYYATGNPYVTEESYPAGREAISTGSTLVGESVSLVRNPSAVCVLITDGNGNVLYQKQMGTQSIASFCRQGTWMMTNTDYTISQIVGELGVKEGDEICVTLLAIPEYYEKNKADLTVEDVVSLYQDGVLGDGVKKEYRFTVDNTAPEITSIYKDLQTGDLKVQVKDNGYTAVVQVRNKAGKVLMTVVPEQTEPGQTLEVTIPLDGITVGAVCNVVAGDYAKNETAYTVEYGGEEEDFSGRMFGFTNISYRNGQDNGWMEIDPATVWYNPDKGKFGGTATAGFMDVSITAAAYAYGYVYMAGNDGNFYVAEHNAWGSAAYAGSYTASTASVKAMTMNYADGKMYVLGAKNAIYTMNLSTCELTKVAQLTLTNPRSKSASILQLGSLAAGPDGMLYGVNAGYPVSTKYSSAFLYKFAMSDVVDGALTIGPMNPEPSGEIWYRAQYSDLAWDYDSGRLYLAASNSGSCSQQSFMLELDPETGAAAKTNLTEAGAYDPATFGSVLYNTIYGMYIVPKTVEPIPGAKDALSISLSETEITCLKNTTLTLEATLLPWNLENQNILWSSSDESVAVVKDGTVLTVGVGDAVITATTAAQPNLEATCTIHSKDMNLSFAGISYDAEGNAYWAKFNTGDPESWQIVADAPKGYTGGTLFQDTLYLNDGTHLLAVDPDRLTVIQDYGEIAEEWLFTDSAPAPEVERNFNGVVAIGGNGTILELIRKADGKMAYWDLSGTFAADPMVAISFSESGMFKYGPYGDCPTVKYYVITESGALYLISALTYTDGSTYEVNCSLLGQTRLKMPGVGSYSSNKYASMAYAEDLGQLILTVSDGKEAKLYAIDVNTRLVAALGTFTGAAGMSSMFAYDRADTLSVRMRTEDQSVYVGDSLQARATVLPAEYEDKVTWSSSDPSVATVNDSGLVTALATGTAVITATSVAADENGQNASASFTVTVLPLKQVDLHVKAQVTNENGSQWVSIDTADLTVTKLADARTQLEGGGVHGGVIYGTEKPSTENIPFIKADPNDNYRETLSTGTVPSMNAVLDAATIPARTDILHDKKGNEYLCDIFGYPMFLYEQGIIGYLDDFDSAEMSNWGLMGVSFHKALCAMAYAGSVPMETDKYGTVNSQKLYVLACDGTLFLFDHYCYYMTVGVSQVVKALNSEILGNVGQDFPNKEDVTMTYVHDDENEGLLIGYGGDEVALYYIDLTDEQLQCRKIGNLPAFTDIASIYTEYDLYLEPTQLIRKGTETESSSFLPMNYEGGQEYIMENLSDGSTNSVSASDPASVVVNEDETLTVSVTVKDANGEDVSAHSGSLNLSYDPDALELTDVKVGAAFHSVVEQDGKVNLAYADLEARDTAATLCFKVKKYGQTTLLVNTAQAESESSGYVEKLTLCANCPSAAYEDLNPNSWYHEYTDYVIANGLMQGWEQMFDPAGSANRAMLVQVLYNLAGRPAAGTDSGFADVDANSWFAEAVTWARSAGVVNGVDDNHFAPGRAVTREEAVTMLYRYAKDYAKIDMIPGADLSAFADQSQISGYSRPAVEWAVAVGLVKGMEDGTILPQGTSNRAQLAALLTRLTRDILK